MLSNMFVRGGKKTENPEITSHRLGTATTTLPHAFNRVRTRAVAKCKARTWRYLPYVGISVIKMGSKANVGL